MAYAGSSGVQVVPLEDGGFTFIVTQRGWDYYRTVGPNDGVSHTEAGALLGVNRATVFKWIRDGKLRDEPLDGFSMVRIQALRRFAMDNDYPWDW